MTLNDYILNGPPTVIAADDRDPYVSWQHHLERTDGLRGGVDLVAAVGTPILAPTAGTMAHIPDDGSAGNSSRFYHDANPGWKDVFSHISTYVGLSGRHFEQGQVIAYSGATGGVSPHVHRHLLDPQNVRRNPWDYFTDPSTAGGGATPISPEEDEMKPVILSNPKGLGILIDWAAATWRGITGGETAGHIANGVKVTQVTDAQFEEAKKFLTERQPK